MKIVVIGGGGLIASELVTSFGGGRAVRGTAHTVLQLPVSTVTGVGAGTEQALALAGAEIVVDVANAFSLVDCASSACADPPGSDLLTSEIAAGVRHHVTLSTVGADRHPEAAYFHARQAQERLVAGSGLPYTIVRSTQFFESVQRIAKTGDADEAIHASPALVQPIAASDAVITLVDVALDAARNGTIEIAGVERIPLDELILRYLASQRNPRPVFSDVRARCFGIELDDTSLTAGAHARTGRTAFDDWLRQLQSRR